MLIALVEFFIFNKIVIIGYSQFLEICHLLNYEKLRIIDQKSLDKTTIKIVTYTYLFALHINLQYKLSRR